MSVALVNTAVGDNATGAAVANISSAAFSLTAGNLLVVGVRQGTDNTTTPTLSDTAGNTFTPIDTSSMDAGNLLSNFYVKNALGNASNVVKASWSVNQAFVAVLCLQYSGVDTSAPLDAHVTTTASGVSTVTSPSFSTVAANEAMVAIAAVNALNITMTTPTAGWTVEFQDADKMSGAIDKIVTTTQSNITVAAHDAGAGSDNWELLVATFKAASGATHGIKRYSNVDGIGASGPFFSDPLGS